MNTIRVLMLHALESEPPHHPSCFFRGDVTFTERDRRVLAPGDGTPPLRRYGRRMRFETLKTRRAC